MLNPIPISIPEGPKSDCITKEVQDLLLDDAIEQVLPNRFSKRVFYSNVFTVPKPGTNLHRPVLDLKRLNTYINNQSFKMEGIKNLPSMVKQGYYMVKLDIKKAYLHVLVDPQYRDLFHFVWKGSHYRWKTMPFGLSTAPRIFTMLLRPVLRMLRDINVSVIAYLDDLLIVGSTKEECLSNLKKTMELLIKLGFKLNLEKSVLEPTQSITFLGLQIDSVSMKLLVPKEKKKSVIKEIRNFLKLDCCSPRKLAGLKGKLIALKDAVIPFRLYTPCSVSDIALDRPSAARAFLDDLTTCIGCKNIVVTWKQTHSFAFYPGEDELIQFEVGFYNTDLPNLEISNLVSDDSSSSSSSSSSHVSSSTGNIPRSIDQTISRVDTNPDSTTLETGDYSTFQSHVMSFARTTNTKTAELLMKSWEPSTLKVYSSSYTRFRNFCTLNSLNPANITLVVFIDYLTHLFKHKPPLAFSTINGHRSMLNQLLLLRNQTDIVNDPFITRIMTGIHKLRPSSAKYKEIWDANQVFKHLSTIKVIPKYTYTALLNKTLVLCKMFGLARSSDLVKWSFKGLIITTDSIKGPVINAKEQRSGVVSIKNLIY
ncbi:hypothetical protein ACTFIT_001927 [Dictyostelium discoideum]